MDACFCGMGWVGIGQFVFWECFFQMKSSGQKNNFNLRFSKIQTVFPKTSKFLNECQKFKFLDVN